MTQSDKKTELLDEDVTKLLAGEKTLANVASIHRRDMLDLALYARRLFLQGKTQTARALFEGLVALDPRIAILHTSLGEVLLREKDFDAALAEFNAALDIDPDHASSLAYKSEILVRQGRHDEAWSGLVEVFLRDPERKTAAGQYAFRLASTLATRLKSNPENQEAMELIHAKGRENAEQAKNEDLKTGMSRFETEVPAKPRPDPRPPSKTPVKPGKH